MQVFGIVRLMRKYGLRSRHYKRPKGLTQVDRCRASAPNLVDQYFETEKPNSIWLADLTYIPTGKGLMYLAAVAARNDVQHEPARQLLRDQA